ncbi:protein seele [Diachasma alloeum]|uniref:protein seele n=1 Tax=Diachasma alloeum TaxID=454923 RepID=UPI0007381536|nr:protein seele [Diachasma alloeum]XP_015123231.1 protein seele [Diachasma alloeum]
MFVFLLGVFVLPALTCAEEIDQKLLQCLVCRITVEEVENVLNTIDPSQQVEVGNYRLDADGNIQKKMVAKRESEVHLSEILDNICDKMDDYVRARYKSNGKLTVMRLMTPEGQMNPDISNVDIIQDGDLNKSLKHYCREIIEEHEDPMIELFQKGGTDVINKICTRETNICDDELPPDDEEEESDDTERDEL